MRNNDLVIFIDSKGVSHNALVKAFREHRDEKGELVHGEPLVSLTYNLPTGEPKELIDVHHMDHPSKQEPNPDLPTYALHAWKHDWEDHLEVPSDHPIHDPQFGEQKFDDAGKPIAKRRPIYESHIQSHKASKRATPPYLTEPADNKLPGANSKVDEFSQPQGVQTEEKHTVPVGHPAHPDTIHFEQNCVSCGKKVRRVASHQGGQQWNVDAPVQHVCKQEDIDAYRESLKPKKEPEMTDLQKAALEPAGDPPKAQENAADVAELARERAEEANAAKVAENDRKQAELAKEAEEEQAEKEVDVITELQNAPPPPDEPNKPQAPSEGELEG